MFEGGVKQSKQERKAAKSQRRAQIRRTKRATGKSYLNLKEVKA